jgi:anthranilate phosphoribosyltransferase
LLRFENGKIFEEEIINPQKYGFKKVELAALKGGDPKHNAEKLVALLDGEKSAYRDIVILNSAFALKLARKVEKVGDGIDLSSSLISNGKAKEALNLLIN